MNNYSSKLGYDTGDLTGMVFGRWRVVGYAYAYRRNDGALRHKWTCVCECGVPGEVETRSLQAGHSKSCGCLFRQRASESCIKRCTSHALSKTREYRIWASMIQRCTNPKTNAFKNYGGRGIIVCKKWLDSFEDFLSDVGIAPSGEHTLDRFPNHNGNYEPGNVRWATSAQQARNTQQNIFVTIGDKTLCVRDWADHFGISQFTIYDRIKRGRPLNESLFAPPNRGLKVQIPTKLWPYASISRCGQKAEHPKP